MSSSTTLEIAAQDRKSRLAQLRSLKRKVPPSGEDENEEPAQEEGVKERSRDFESSSSHVARTYIRGRNYDLETGGAKLGFEHNPAEGVNTLELQARVIAETTRREAEEEDKFDKPVDLFKLQPKKPNWDLKRNLDRKLEVLNIRTDNAIAKIVRGRVAKAQAEAKSKGTEADGEALGLDGPALMEAVRQREREEEEDEQRAREDGDDL